jgi:hypothetical protein
LETALLIAITSFRRCSDLQALCIGEESVVVQKKGVTFNLYVMESAVSMIDFTEAPLKSAHDGPKALVE